MVHVRFDPADFSYDTYFQQQRGGSYFEGLPLHLQRGYGRAQYGAGVGDVFRKFWRFLVPIAKSFGPVMTEAGKAIGQEGLATTARVLNDVVQGATIKDAIES